MVQDDNDIPMAVLLGGGYEVIIKFAIMLYTTYV